MERQPIPNTSPQKYYAADGLMGAYITMGEWDLYDVTMAAFKDSEFGSRVIWCLDEQDPLCYVDKKTDYDLSQADYLNMCGDLDGDGVKNCNEYWAATPNGYAGALNPAVMDAGVTWSAWTCLDENNSSVRFAYNPDTDRVYTRSQVPMTFADAKLVTGIQYPGGSTIPVVMATIRNAAENAYVLAVANGDTVWVGLTDEAVEGTFAWLSGEPVTYTNWNEGEPNNSGNEDYCEFRDDGKWNDNGDSARYVVFETTGTWPDDNSNGAPDAFEDLNGDLIPDAFGIPRPSADFVADVTNGDMPLEVHFTDLSDPGEPAPEEEDPVITSWLWDFGDGETSTEQDPTHTYMAVEPFSTYPVSLTIITVNNPPDDVRTDTMTKTSYITVIYVCAFEDKLTEQGGSLNDAIMAADPAILSGVKTDLEAASMTTWGTWDIEGLPGADPGDGLPDAAQMALIEHVACHTWLNASTLTFIGMTTNKELFETDMATLGGDFEDLAEFSIVFAGLIGSSTEMKDTVDEMFVTMGEAGLPSYAEYVVFGVGKEGPLFGADGDADGDGLTNLVEYEQVVATGGGIATFVDAATDYDNFWDGNPDLPVAGILGLGLLVGAMLAGAALALRKK